MSRSEATSRHLLTHRRHRRPRRVDHRRTVVGVTAAIAGSVLAALMLTGGSFALWNSSATTQIPSLTAGSAAVETQGLSSLATTYKLISAQSKTGGLQITNSGSGSASYSTSVALSADSSTTMAKDVVVSVWKGSSLAACAGTAPSGAASGTWAAVPAMTGTLAAGASAVYCVQTSMTSANIVLISGKVTATLVVTLKSGSWTGTTTASVTQNVVGFFGNAATKAPAVAASPAPTVPDPSAWYTIASADSGACLQLLADAVDGTAVDSSTCDPSATGQQWQFRATSDGYSVLVSRLAPTLGLGLSDTAVQGQSITGATTQQWQPVSTGAGTYHLVSRSDGQCLTPTDTAGGLQRAACGTGAAQSFILGAVS